MFINKQEVKILKHKKLWMFTLISLSAIILFSSVNADSILNEKISIDKINLEKTYYSEKFNAIDCSSYIELNKEKICLYPVFVDPNKAIENFKDKNVNVIEKVKKDNGFSELTADNINDYYDKIIKCCTENPKYMDSYNDFMHFWDIYENYESNKEILDYLEEKKISFEKSNSSVETTKLSIQSNVSSDIISDLNILLPYNSSANNFILNKEIKSTNSSTFNISLGIKYAIKYATNRNKENYGGYSEDCANFASQILEAGGVSQTRNSENDATKGWWHTKEDLLGGLGAVHKTSQVWRLPDKFAKYQGVYAKTKDHYTFSSRIDKGDFIAGDWESDGDWNHIGFVVAANNQSGTYGNSCYFDYKVAQHTIDFLEWTSSSNSAWETIGENGGTYCRLRRSA